MPEENGFIETAREAVTQLKRLVHEYPTLTTLNVRQAIETWDEDIFRKRGPIWLEQQRKRKERDALERRAVELIETHQMEDVLDMLGLEFERKIDYQDLIDLCGRERYIAALRREGMELKANSISPQQTADLWNSAGKPAVGGKHWNAIAVSVLTG